MSSVPQATRVHNDISEVGCNELQPRVTHGTLKNRDVVLDGSSRGAVPQMTGAQGSSQRSRAHASTTSLCLAGTSWAASCVSQKEISPYAPPCDMPVCSRYPALAIAVAQRPTFSQHEFTHSHSCKRQGQQLQRAETKMTHVCDRRSRSSSATVAAARNRRCIVVLLSARRLGTITLSFKGISGSWLLVTLEGH